nr:oxygenase MpaB family protein [Mycolicibacter kumamotonensis]
MTELLSPADRPMPAAETTGPTDDDGLSLLRGEGLRPRVMADFRKHLGSVLNGVFGGVLFDEVAMLPIAASVDRTGRFRDNFTDRGLRSAFSGQAILAGAEQRKKHAQWLIDQHRSVRGTGVGEYDGVRYSALDPDLWLWIIASALHAIIVSYPVCSGTTLRPAEVEAGYQYLRHLFGDLELPSKRGRLPETFEAFNTYYEDTVATGLAANGFLRDQFTTLTRLPLPTLLLPRWLRPVLTPPWLVVRPLLGHVVQVCSAKTMHPDVLALIGFELKRRHHWEFAVYSRLLQLAWHLLPDRLLLEPIHYNRIRLDALRERLDGTARAQARYDRAAKRLQQQNSWLAGFYERYGLDTFSVPEHRVGACPFG